MCGCREYIRTVPTLDPHAKKRPNMRLLGWFIRVIRFIRSIRVMLDLHAKNRPKVKITEMIVRREKSKRRNREGEGGKEEGESVCEY